MAMVGERLTTEYTEDTEREERDGWMNFPNIGNVRVFGVFRG